MQKGISNENTGQKIQQIFYTNISKHVNIREMIENKYFIPTVMRKREKETLNNLIYMLKKEQSVQTY